MIGHQWDLYLRVNFASETVVLNQVMHNLIVEFQIILSRLESLETSAEESLTFRELVHALRLQARPLVEILMKLLTTA